jgi:hypothetical protein
MNPSDPTPSETLRAAAARLRALAEAATPPPWRTVALRDDDPAYGLDVEPGVAVGNDSSGACELPDATWIATMNPAVAEPLAAWLERDADAVKWTLQASRRGMDEPYTAGYIRKQFAAPLAFARTILEQP